MEEGLAVSSSTMKMKMIVLTLSSVKQQVLCFPGLAQRKTPSELKAKGLGTGQCEAIRVQL